MDKTAGSDVSNSVTRLPIPLFGDVNNRRFVTAVLSGVIGGAGVGAASSLLRAYRDMRKKKTDETDDETIVMTLPKKKAEDGYTSMRDAKPGERKLTTSGGRQFRESGRFGKSVAAKEDDKGSVKCSEGNPGLNSVGTVVANTLGLTAGGLLSYEVVSRLFDEMNERRLKRKLQAAQQAYVNAMTGASKRAEIVTGVTDPVEHVILRDGIDKKAGILDLVSDSLPDSVSNSVRYPTAAYLLALLAGTGSTAYITKKVLDREFPEEKIKKDVNKPTRIVFKTAEGRPALVEGDVGAEKEASADTCAALTVLMPVYMDVVEGRPNRTLSAPYVKLAEAAGLDPEGLMKLAEGSLDAARRVVMRDPSAVWSILKGTKFGLDFNAGNAVNILRDSHPETYRRAVDSAIDAHFAGGPNDGMFTRFYNSAGRAVARGIARAGGRDWLVRQGMKTAETKEGRLAGFSKYYDRMLKSRADEARKVLYARLGTEGTGLSAIRGTGYAIIGSGKQDDTKNKANTKRQDTTGKTASIQDLVQNAFKNDSTDDKETETMATKEVLYKARKNLKGKRRVSVEAADPRAAVYISKNRDAIRRALSRLSRSGSI